MDDRRVADYFVVAGLPDNPDLLGDLSRDGAHLKTSHNQAPLTDIKVFFPGLGEEPPCDYTVLRTTPTGLIANLNHGSLRSPEVFLCYRRGRDKPPLVDIGVMYEGKERIMADSEIILTTPGGRPANVNNSSAKTFVTYRRAKPTMPCNELVVTDVCVIISSKGEYPPHAFCVIHKNLNKGMVGSDVYLCYKKSMNRATLISYKPGILLRYPLTDLENFPFPSSVPLFCLPMGSSIECWPAKASQPRPVFSTFVLTVSDAAEKVYGAAVTFYERISKDALSQEQCEQLELNVGGEEKTININKCICLLSHWPFFDTFDKFLSFLYNMSNEGPHAVPIERYISHFLEDVPFPSPQRPQILIQLSASERVILTQPEDLPLPRSGAGFKELLINLGPENCLMVLLLTLTEQKLLIHSLRPDVLTAVAEAVSMIIFPFKWQCPYIPLCPLALAEVLHAPLPFLIGVDSRFFDLYDPPTDVSCVDLDTVTITLCEERRSLTMKLLPKKPARMLRNRLEQIHQKLHEHNLVVRKMAQEPNKESIDRDFKIKRREQALELEIQEAFLHFMATILKGYRLYLLPITKAPTVGTTDPNSLFDLQGFLRSRDRNYHKFFTLIMKTQMFIRFIEERSFVSDMDAGLAFFDECADKVFVDDDDGRVHLLEMDESHKSERTVFILPPEPTGLPPGLTYFYKGFNLNQQLLSRKDMKSSLNVGPRLSGCLPGSPMARRTKQEIKSAQKLAKKYAVHPESWAKYLLGTCYSLWFIHLPSYAMVSRRKAAACLQTAYELLVRIQKMKLTPTDEVCYRVMMQLCGVYSQPVLAVKLLYEMKRSGIQPNALTYGFYNRAVLEATWPSDCTNSSQLLWNKLRNVIIGVALFRRSGALRRRLSEDVGSMADAMDGISRTSVDSGNSHESAQASGIHDAVDTKIKLSTENKPSNKVNSADTGFAQFDKFRSRVGSIVRPCGIPLLPPVPHMHQQPFESSAGLLMTGLYNGPSIPEERDLFDGDAEQVTPTNQRRRNRSGSCSEFTFGLRHSPGSGCQPTSPKASRSPDVNNPRECWRLLSRSESFANDAQILDNLSLPSESCRVPTILEKSPDNKYSTTVKGSSSRSLFGWRNSLTFRRQSQESSTEHLEDRSSAGSTDDLDCSDNRTPKHFSKLLGSRMNRIGSDLWNHVGLRKLDSDSSLPKSSTDSLLLETQEEKEIKNSFDDKSDQNCDILPKSPVPSSQKTSPIRTPVTENDPLGALDMQDIIEDVEHVDQADSSSASVSSSATPSNILISDSERGPVLFGGQSRGVSRSATFTLNGSQTEEEVLEDTDGQKHRTNIQRSSTMPVDVPTTTAGGVASSLSSLGSSFKLPFSRYSPARLSLRKADLRIGTQIIENALTNFSPSSITSKKSNELLMGGINSIKSAATSVAKKIDELKEAMSVNTTPVRANASYPRPNDRDSTCMDDDMLDTSVEPDRRRISNEFSHSDLWGTTLLGFSEIGRKDSSTNLQPLSLTSSQQLFPDNLYPRDAFTRDPRAPVALEVMISSCSKCHNCSSVLYDEEIMAGWVPDDSNLNTKCQFCTKETVPFLTITILDFRSQPRISSSGSQESVGLLKSSLTQLSSPTASNSSVNATQASEVDDVKSQDNECDPLSRIENKIDDLPLTLEPITVPYLNPMVLRKEFENILHNEGDSSLTQACFVDEHPIIYWNMVWFFQRINIISHLPGLCLKAASANKGNQAVDSSWENADHNNVVVRCMWDNHRLHEEVGLPMYILWQQKETQSSLVSALVTDRTTVSRSIMEGIISSVRCNDLMEPLKKLATERQKLKGRGVNRSHSLYRDILFLAFTVIGRENIDQSAFDREYVAAYESLPQRDSKLYNRSDQPLSLSSLYCRHYFKELEL